MPELPSLTSSKNKLLASLSAEEYARLTPHLKRVQLPKGKVLYQAGDLVRDLYFIDDGQVSLLSTTSGGATIEVAMVGNEGVVGIHAILRSRKIPYEAMVQLPVSSALRVQAEVVNAEFNRCGRMQDMLLRYTQVLLIQITQSALCNRFHSSEQRLARWLLISNDMAKSNTFHMTHEFLAHMLGMPRTGVTMAAGTLQRENVIRYSRGKLTIRNRQGLERLSCECYKLVREAFDTFLEAAAA